jgi:hypothetical protein
MSLLPSALGRTLQLAPKVASVDNHPGAELPITATVAHLLGGADLPSGAPALACPDALTTYGRERLVHALPPTANARRSEAKANLKMGEGLAQSA